MPDVYVRVTEAPRPILDGLMAALELRAADPQLRAMLTAYLTDAALPAGARVLEVGCGTGAITRADGYVESLAPGFMLRSWVDMGADALAASGVASKAEAEDLKAEARRRIAGGEYFGHIAYVSLVARKPA